MSQDEKKVWFASSASGLMQKIVTIPLTVITQRSQGYGLNIQETIQRMRTMEQGVGSNTLQGLKPWLYGLWKGTVLSIGKTGLYTSIQQPLYLKMVYSEFRQKDLYSALWFDGLGSYAKPFATNVSLGAVSWLSASIATGIVYPIDLVRNRFVNRLHMFSTNPQDRWSQMWNVWQDIWRTCVRERSLQIMFRGFPATMISSSPFNIINGILFFTMFDTWQWSKMWAGGAAAGIASAMTHPLDTITLRITVMKTLEKPMSFMGMAKYMWKTQGLVESQLQKGYTIHPITGLVTKSATGQSVPIQTVIANACPGQDSMIWRRRFKTFTAGIVPNVIKGGSTYFLRWMFFDLVMRGLSLLNEGHGK